MKAIVLTHTHNDHIDGIKDFQGVRTIVNELEWKNADLPVMYPDWLKPDTVNMTYRHSKEFDKAYPLTTNKDLVMIHTPGHTKGHCSVLLKTDEVTLIFAGDIVYGQEQLRTHTFSAVNDTFKGAEQSYRKLKEFMKNNPTIFLPSHDPGGIQRLKNKETY